MENSIGNPPQPEADRSTRFMSQRLRSKPQPEIDKFGLG